MPKHDHEAISARNQLTLNAFLPYWLNNARQNAAVINKYLLNASEVPLNNKDTSKAIILASGGSLYKQKDLLKDLNKYLVVATPTNYAFALAHGLVPDILFVADASPKQIQDIFAAQPHHPNTVIVAHPGIDPSVLQIWPHDKIYWFKSFIQMPDGSLIGEYNDFTNKLFVNLKDHLVQAGNCTNQAMLFFEMLHRRNVLTPPPSMFLLGYDLSFTKNAFRLPKYRRSYIDRFEEIPEPSAAKSLDTMKQIKHQGKLTNIQMFNYHRTVLMLWQLTTWQVWNCSPTSALVEVPYWPLKDLVKGKFPPEQDPDLKHQAWKDFLEAPDPTLPDGTPVDIFNFDQEPLSEAILEDPPKDE